MHDELCPWLQNESECQCSLISLVREDEGHNYAYEEIDVEIRIYRDAGIQEARSELRRVLSEFMADLEQPINTELSSVLVTLNYELDRALDALVLGDNFFPRFKRFPKSVYGDLYARNPFAFNMRGLT